MNRQRIALIAVFLLLLISSVAFAEDTSKGIMVWQLEAKTGVSMNDIVSISGLLTAKVETYSGRKVVSEADIQTILKGEETRQKCGMEGTNCIAEIGAALGVPEAVSGDVGRVGTIWVLNLRRINIRTAEVSGRTSRQMDGEIDDLMLVIPGAVAELFGKKAPEIPGILLVNTTPEGALVKVGERELGITPLKKRLKAGAYKLSVRLDGHLSEDRTVTLKSGEKSSAILTLTRVPMNPYKLYGHVTFWSGLGIVALGGVFTGLSSAKMSEHDDKIDKGQVKAAQNAMDSSKSYSAAAISMYTIGGAAMVTGAILWILSPGDEAWAREHMISAGPTPAGDGALVLLSGRW